MSIKNIDTEPRIWNIPLPIRRATTCFDDLIAQSLAVDTRLHSRKISRTHSAHFDMKIDAIQHWSRNTPEIF